MRLIDADALKDHLEDLRSYTALNKEHGYYRGETNALKIAIRNIDNAPTIDAVPVVRCEDCWRSVILYSDDNPIDGYCRLHNIAVTQEFFCADGERRTNHEAP